MIDTYRGHCSWCAKLMLPVHKITEIYIGTKPNQYYLKTMHSLCSDEEYESYSGVRAVLQKVREATFKAFDEEFKEGLTDA